MTNNSFIIRSRVKLQDRWTLKHLDLRQFNVINMVKVLDGEEGSWVGHNVTPTTTNVN